ncbi:MAG: hypothetical protein LBQ82_06345, partial [Treponema sp.]|nr:hypothetical protein [Treponema sp.]
MKKLSAILLVLLLAASMAVSCKKSG